MKQGKTLAELKLELQRCADEKEDLIADAGTLYLKHDGTTLSVGDRGSFTLTPHSRHQLATWAGIPTQYADKCMSDDPALFATNVNYWLKRVPVKRMVRCLDGNVRAFLSDQYLRLDNEAVAKAVFPVLLKASNIRLVSYEITDSRLYIKAVFPRLKQEVVFSPSRGEMDSVQAGVVISNSEIGLGSLQVRPLAYGELRSNGMVLGSEPDSWWFKDSCRQISEMTTGCADRATTRLIKQVCDLAVLSVRQASSRPVFRRLVKKMRDAPHGEKIVRSKPAVGMLGATLGLTSAETGLVLEALIHWQDYSRWGALNAVTAIANVHEDYDRATEIEIMGGQVLEMNPSQWAAIARAA